MSNIKALLFIFLFNNADCLFTVGKYNTLKLCQALNDNAEHLRSVVHVIMCDDMHSHPALATQASGIKLE